MKLLKPLSSFCNSYNKIYKIKSKKVCNHHYKYSFLAVEIQFTIEHSMNYVSLLYKI